MADTFYVEGRMSRRVRDSGPGDGAHVLLSETETPGLYCVATHNVSPNSFLNITGAATTVVKTGAGILRRLVFNDIVALSTVTLYDNTAASGDVIATVTFPLSLLKSQDVLDYGLIFENGLTIVTTLTSDITVVYR